MKRKHLIFLIASLIAAFGFAPAQAQTLTVTYPTATKISPRMSDLKGAPFVNGPTIIRHPKISDIVTGYSPKPNGALQTQIGPMVSATTGTGFTGMGVNDGGYIPSDNNIAVGPNHIVEVVNAAYAVYNKSGAKVLGPLPMKNLWTNLTGNACAANNGGDVVVLYDRQADRWFLSQLGSLSSPYSQCIAVSQTSDPTGAYYLYSYSFSSNLNDYPKFGVWPTTTNSAYLGTYNLFANGSSFAGAEICAYDRTAMLSGAASPASICYTGLSGASYLPVDLDGPTPPVDGTPAYFMDLSGSGLGVYTMKPNFTNATATLSAYSSLSVSGYSQAGSSPQPGTTRTLDSLSDRLMFRLALRMFPDHEAIVATHSVVGTGSSSGVRWYELRAPVSNSGSFSLYQQGTYSPDSSYRWMSSAAMDQSGDIAIGYSLSSSTLYPSVAFTGRLPTDQSGTMQTEAVLKTGTGSQTGYSRWGDYTSMRIDPSDDCTFWFVNEYVPTTSSYGWSTYIGSFKFPSCSSNPLPDFSLSTSPTSATVTRNGTGGTSATSVTVSVTPLNGFNGSVDLTYTGCPTGVTCSFGTTPLSFSSSQATQQSAMSITSTTSASAGNTPVTITGTSGSIVHSGNLALTVNADYALNMSSSTVTVRRGSRTTVIVTPNVLDGGPNFLTSLSVGPLPAGVSASFSRNPDSTGTGSTLTISAKQNAKIGTKSVTVTSSAFGKTETNSFTLTIQ